MSQTSADKKEDIQHRKGGKKKKQVVSNVSKIIKLFDTINYLFVFVIF